MPRHVSDALSQSIATLLVTLEKTPQRHPHIMLKNLFTSPLSRPRQMVDIQYDNVIMGGREVSRPYRVWFFAEGECSLCFCFCAPSIYPLNHKKSSNKHFVGCGG